MDNSNIKIYLGISFALIIIFIFIIFIPFTKKPSPTNLPQPTPYNLLPTTVETNPTDSTDTTDLSNSISSVVPVDFTGVAEKEIPQQVIDLAAQKKDLRDKTPLSLSTFTIDFDYNDDKFTVSLKDPKDQSQNEFESWRTANYSLLESGQFILK